MAAYMEEPTMMSSMNMIMHPPLLSGRQVQITFSASWLSYSDVEGSMPCMFMIEDSQEFDTAKVAKKRMPQFGRKLLFQIYNGNDIDVDTKRQIGQSRHLL